MTKLHEPFAQASRQREADKLGMLVFLSSELMLFGGIFGAALSLRVEHAAAYVEAAHGLKLWLGTANTAILLTSSLFAALAVVAARAGRPGRAGGALGVAVSLGFAFLIVKGAEYVGEYREGLMPATAAAHFATGTQQLFMNLYFLATGLHALHVMVGMGLLSTAALSPGARRARDAVLIGNAALYWHFVDAIWVFLYPTLYLAGVR